MSAPTSPGTRFGSAAGLAVTHMFCLARQNPDFAALNPGCELCVRGDMLACVVATSAHHREESEDGNL